jgi:chemotaxis protein MotB
MKRKSNEWVSIADLMAGVMAVVMLLLVLSVLQRTFAAETVREAQQKQISRVLGELKKSFPQDGGEALVKIDVGLGRIYLQKRFFANGSACVAQTEALEAIEIFRPPIANLLEHNSDVQVLVEGHTDSNPVRGLATNEKGNCAVYDDNYTLSAARAREVRNALLGKADQNKAYARRIIVAGYGDSDPLSGRDPTDPRNRRVEIRFAFQALDTGTSEHRR